MSKHQAFTLVEMMVVISLFFIITGIILVNVPNFREKTSVDLVAQDVAVTIRSAQVFGIGTKALNDDAVGYGIYLSNSTDQNNQFVLFADIDNDLQFNQNISDCGPDTECQSLYQLAGFHVASVVAYDDSDDILPLDEINILFQRPKSSPVFCIPLEDGCDDTLLQRVEITIESNREKKQKNVVVYSNGQIAVEDVASNTNDE